MAKIQEAAAFETELLTVLTLEELLDREKAALAAMEEELQELGGRMRYWTQTWREVQPEQ